MELHDKIMLPDLGKEAVLRSVKDAEYSALAVSYTHLTLPTKRIV